jgi:hypothetical protein
MASGKKSEQDENKSFTLMLHKHLHSFLGSYEETCAHELRKILPSLSNYITLKVSSYHSTLKC